MTAQIPDEYIVSRKPYSLIAMSNDIEFNPRDFGIEPVAMHSGCWRGYFCKYRINKKGLFLDELNINSNAPLPTIDGIEPQIYSQYDNVCSGRYKRLKRKIDYTGSIVLGTGFLDQYYIHMGFQRAWAYEKVIEVVFEKGNVVKIIDHSEKVNEIREAIDSGKDLVGRSYISKFISDSFSLDAKVKAWWLFDE